MSELRACPCGKVPDQVAITCDCVRPKWARACCPCYDWSVEFRNNYAEIGSDEMKANAERAWNNAKRAGDGEGGE